jgi:hypothetical protein
MESKLLTILLIGLLVFSSLNLALGAKVKCPTCIGTGEKECPTCNGTGKIADGDIATCAKCLGIGNITPRIMMTGMTAGQPDGKTHVTATFRNQETVEVYGTATATLADHSVTSPETVFPPGQEVKVELVIDYVGSYSSMHLMQALQATATASGNITCPSCNGTGLNAAATCPDCDGTGIVKCPDCKGTGYVEEGLLTTAGSLNIPIIAGGAGAAVAVVAGGGATFFLLKKKRVSEKSLRSLPSSEFQTWVLKRLDGKTPSSKDTALGIDGFSRLNEPISIKQLDSVGMAAIDSFAATLAKSSARGGIIVAFGFSDDAMRGRVRARTTYRLDIRMMTIRDLIENRGQSY